MTQSTLKPNWSVQKAILDRVNLEDAHLDNYSLEIPEKVKEWRPEKVEKDRTVWGFLKSIMP